MNTQELKDAIPENAAGLAAPAVPQAALIPQAATPVIDLVQSDPVQTPPSGELASAGFGGVLGRIDVLSEPEEQRLLACEGAIQAGWHRFIEVGVALAEIRDERLYRNDFTSFEQYCACRWDFKRGKAHYLISAARICRRISGTPGLPQPERESQLRPLLAVSLEDAELAWQYAAQFGGGGPVTARMVRRAVSDLHLPLIGVRPALPQVRQSKRELKRNVSEMMVELLGLITQKADYSTLLEKFEALHGQLRLVFKPEKPRKRQAGEEDCSR